MKRNALFVLNGKKCEDAVRQGREPLLHSQRVSGKACGTSKDGNSKDLTKSGIERSYSGKTEPLEKSQPKSSVGK